MYPITIRSLAGFATKGLSVLVASVLAAGCAHNESQLPSPRLEAPTAQTATPDKEIRASAATLKVYNERGSLQWEMALADDNLTFVDSSGYFFRFQNEADAKRFLSGEDGSYAVIQGGQDWENAGGLTLRASDQKIVRPNGAWPFHPNEATYKFAPAVGR